MEIVPSVKGTRTSADSWLCSVDWAMAQVIYN